MSQIPSTSSCFNWTINGHLVHMAVTCPISRLLLIWLFQQNAIGCGSVICGWDEKVRSAPYLGVRRRFTRSPQTEQGLECSHGCPAAVVAENKLIQINLELIPAYTVMGSDQPLLQVADGPIGEWHHRFRAFAKVALQGLGARNMSETCLFKAGEALEPIRVNDGVRGHVLFQKSQKRRALEIRDDGHPDTPTPAAPFLHGHQNQCGFPAFQLAASPQTSLRASNPSLIDLHFTPQRLTFQIHHRPAKPVEHHPCRLITSKAELTLQKKRRDATFVGAQIRYAAQNQIDSGSFVLCIIVPAVTDT